MAHIKTVLAYLGYRGNNCDGQVLETISQAEKEILKCCGEPKSVMGIWNCHVDNNVVNFNGYDIKSKDLEKHLAKSEYIGVFAVTLGVQADALINTYGVSDLHRSVVTDAVASVMVNEYCDKLCAELADYPNVANLKQTKRFSPGYGDFDLKYQHGILNILGAGKRIGVAVTDGNMLVPSKSVTAVLGFV